MGKKISPAVIGGFVVASLAILIVALIVVVGAGKMFRRPTRFICMFTGDLNGLKIGAPVKVREVQVGEVSAIRLRLDSSEGELRTGFNGFRLPVIIDLDQTMLSRVLNDADAQIGPLVTDLRETSDETDKTLKGVQATLTKLQQGLDPNPPARAPQRSAGIAQPDIGVNR
jgi:ABC-type transporter Mla subunit MlaD